MLFRSFHQAWSFQQASYPFLHSFLPAFFLSVDAVPSRQHAKRCWSGSVVVFAYRVFPFWSLEGACEPFAYKGEWERVIYVEFHSWICT